MLSFNKPGILFLFLLLLAACHSEEDVQDPVIEFIEPEELSAVNLPDTLDVRALITDNYTIRTVTLNLVDENKIPVMPGKNYYPNTSEFNLATSMVLEDKSMKTGSYLLQVMADDGTNTKIKYREILIHEIPVEILGYMAVTAPLSFKSTLVRLDTGFETIETLDIPETHWLSAAHGLWEQFYFISDEPSVLTAYNPFSFEIEWEVAASPPRALFTAIIPDQDLLFSTANGDVGIISNDGTITLRTAAYADKTINSLAADFTYIYAAHQSLSGNINELNVYYRVTGEIRVQELLAGEILGLLPVHNAIMVFMRSGADIKIITYNPEDFTIVSAAMLESEIFIAAEKISDNEIFILTERCVVSYNAGNESFTDFTSEPYEFCRYDELNDVVFLGKDVRVFRYDRLTGDLLTLIPFSEEVLDFQILYNK